MTYKLIIHTQDSKSGKHGSYVYPQFHEVENHECRPEGIYIYMKDDGYSKEAFMPWSAEGGIDLVMKVEYD